MEAKQLIVDESHQLFNKDRMFHKQFVSDHRKVRYYALLVVQKAPVQMQEINLLEQQISELLKNAVKHGNRGDLTKQINVWYYFSDDVARIIVEDEGEGFKDLELWNTFNQKRMQCLQDRDFEALGDYVSFHTENSDEDDGGNAIFAALEYWNMGMVYNSKKNAVAVGRHFAKKRLHL